MSVVRGFVYRMNKIGTMWSGTLQDNTHRSVTVGCTIIIIIIQEISIAHNPELKAGAQCAHRKTQNELPI